MPHSQADPRSWRVTDLAVAALSLLGIAVAAYLTLVHYRDDLLVCGVTGGCHTVQKSKYAVMAGVPVAILGLAMYVGLFVLAVLRGMRPAFRERISYLNFGIALAGVAYSIYLTYIELFVIDAICQWCVVSAIVITAICVLEGFVVWRLLGPEPYPEN